MTPESPLDALRRLDRKATPGPWYQGVTGVRKEKLLPQVDYAAAYAFIDVHTTSDDGADGVNDAALIVTLRNTLPALLRLVEEIEAIKDELTVGRYCEDIAFTNLVFALAELTTPAPAEEESHE